MSFYWLSLSLYFSFFSPIVVSSIYSFVVIVDVVVIPSLLAIRLIVFPIRIYQYLYIDFMHLRFVSFRLVFILVRLALFNIWCEAPTEIIVQSFTCNLSFGGATLIEIIISSFSFSLVFYFSLRSYGIFFLSLCADVIILHYNGCFVILSIHLKIRNVKLTIATALNFLYSSKWKKNKKPVKNILEAAQFSSKKPNNRPHRW